MALSFWLKTNWDVLLFCFVILRHNWSWSETHYISQDILKFMISSTWVLQWQTDVSMSSLYNPEDWTQGFVHALSQLSCVLSLSEGLCDTLNPGGCYCPSSGTTTPPPRSAIGTLNSLWATVATPQHTTRRYFKNTNQSLSTFKPVVASCCTLEQATSTPSSADSTWLLTCSHHYHPLPAPMMQFIALLQLSQSTAQPASGLLKFCVSGLEWTSSSPRLDSLSLTLEAWDLTTGWPVSARLR